MRILVYTSLLVCVFAITAPAASSETARLLMNGLWFNGTQFEPRTVLVRNAKLELEQAEISAAKDAEVMDLKGGYVIPPFCEGHNHNIAVGKPELRNLKYLTAGVFYVEILNNAPQLAAAEKEFWNRDDTVDVSFAQGGLTGKGGHPVELLEGIRRGGGYPPGTELADHAYFELETIDELHAKWPLILSFHPDILKLFLEYSETYEVRKNDPAFYGKRGLSPEVFTAAVDLAHKEGLRVAAHITSAADFHLAVQAGVDLIAHLPGYKSVEEIDPKDARLAAERKIGIITTASLAKSLAESGSLDSMQSTQKRNLRLLKDAGAVLIVGSDSWSDTSHYEVAYLRSLGIFSDLELLQMWTATCASAVFPQRRIGRLESGNDADFLVLDGNPLEDFNATRRIQMRIKHGRTLDLPTH